MLAILVAAFIYILSRRRIKTPLLALTTQHASTLLPPNSWAAEDSSRFNEQLENGHIEVTTTEWNSNDRSGKNPRDLALRLLRERLANVAKLPGGPDKNAVIIYISTHGVVNKNNEPCLLVTGSDPLDSETWLSVAALLSELKTAWTSGGRPSGESVMKVLVLDCNRMDMNWSCGLLHNSFADRLEALIREQPDTNLAVINSTQPAGSGKGCEIGWAAPELGASVFGYYVAQGLDGDADKYGNGDARVSLKELANYLGDQVQLWVKLNRDAQQRPKLMQPQGAKDSGDILLTDCDANGPTPDDRKKEESRRRQALGRWNRTDDWNEVARWWTKHDELKQQEVCRWEPVKWARFERDLLRAEQLLLAGQAHADEAADLLRAKLPEQALDFERSVANITAYSLPLCEKFSSPPKVVESATVKTADGSPPAGNDRGRSAWNNLAAKEAIKLDDVGLALRSTQPAPGDRAPVVEIQFLRMLNAYLDDKSSVQGDKMGQLLSTAIKSRQEAEDAAAPDDVRAHYWIAAEVDQADELRRAAEDRMFVSPASAASAPQDWQSASRGYESARGRGENVADAFGRRDLTWAEILYLAQWLWSPRSAVDEPGRNNLRRAIASLHELSLALDRALESRSEEFQDSKNTLAGLLKDLEATFEQSSDVLDATKAGVISTTPGTFRDIDDHLALPLVKAASRKSLRDKYLRRLVDYQPPTDDRLPSAQAAAAPASGAQDHQGQLDLAAHPLVELLSIFLADDKADEKENLIPPNDATPESVSGWMAVQGDVIRKWLSQVDGQSKETIRSTDEKLGQLKGKSEKDAAEIDPAQFASIRKVYSRAEQSIRAAAPIYPSTSDAPRKLRDLDLNQFLLWQCRRALDDFWGPADPNQGESEDYFRIVGDDYLRQARERFSTNAAQLVAHETLLNTRTQAAKELVTAEANSVSLSKDAKDPVPLENLRTVQAAGGLPPGLAALYLCDTDTRDAEALRLVEAGGAVKRNRIGVPIPAKNREGRVEGKFSFEPPSEPADKSPMSKLYATVLYRGHRKIDEIPVSSGVRIEYVPDKKDPPSVAVFGEKTGTTSVMFIFDCSGSMSHTSRNITRLDAARGVMERFLGELEAENQKGNQYNVGFRIYGHRLKYESVPDPKQPGRRKPVPDPLNPGKVKIGRSRYTDKYVSLLDKESPDTDVELIQSIRLLRRDQLRELTERLDALEPWGQTPLYLAIWKSATEDFRRIDQEKRIVVITDGLNELGDERTPNQKFVADLRKVLVTDKPDIKLDIIGYGSEFAPEGVTTLRTLAQETHGDFYEATDADRLRTVLRESLQKARFVVARRGQRPEQEPKKLNEAWQINPTPSSKAAYDVAVVTGKVETQPKATVWLEGDEKLALYLEKSRLVHKRYKPDETCSQAVMLRAPTSDGVKKLWVAAHLPDVDLAKHDARFLISVQNDVESQFSPRPREVWIEITPLEEDKPAEEVYRFSDLNFVPGMAVPVVTCVAPDFPIETCRRARIDFWFKLEPTTSNATQVKTVRELQNNYEFKPAGIELRAELPGVEGDDETARLVIVESASNAGMPSKIAQVKVEMDSSSTGQPRPERVVHDYEARRHTFYFARAQKDRLADCGIRLTSVEQFKQEANREKTHCELVRTMRRPR